jgi:hypothetical protein
MCESAFSIPPSVSTVVPVSVAVTLSAAVPISNKFLKRIKIPVEDPGIDEMIILKFIENMVRGCGMDFSSSG